MSRAQSQKHHCVEPSVPHLCGRLSSFSVSRASLAAIQLGHLDLVPVLAHQYGGLVALRLPAGPGRLVVSLLLAPHALRRCVDVQGKEVFSGLHGDRCGRLGGWRLRMRLILLLQLLLDMLWRWL